ncbi:MAG: NeuD/PglB/VioB family sugar acetyltransferase [Planctomycetaceae bacterium]|nr:NeuD/PglB/VioB family sugar acetyltransferase [Planctomycetaceae bacterium]
MAGQEEFSRVVVPHEIVNDAEVTVVRLLARAGAPVRRGQAVAEIETSKSVIEVMAPVDGYFFPLVEGGKRLVIGATLGVVSPDTRFDPGSLAAPRPDPAVGSAAITEPARRLIAQHGLDPSLFAGLELVRKADVEAYLDGRAGAGAGLDQGAEAPLFVHQGFAPDRTTGAKTDVLILGARGHGAVIIDILHRDPAVHLLGLADANPARLGSEVAGGYKVIALQSEVLDRFDPTRVALFIAVGDNRVRLEVAETFAAVGYRFVNAIDPTAKVALGARLGTGVAIMPQAVVGARASIGDHVIINTKSSIDHDCIVGRAAHIAPGATLGGTVRVGERTLVGIGCAINKGIGIGRDVSIASGFTLYRNVTDGQTLTPKLGRLWW